MLQFEAAPGTIISLKFKWLPAAVEGRRRLARQSVATKPVMARRGPEGCRQRPRQERQSKINSGACERLLGLAPQQKNKRQQRRA